LTLTGTYTTEAFPQGSGPITTATVVFTGTAPANTVTTSVPAGASTFSVTFPAADTYSWSITNLDAKGDDYGTAFTSTAATVITVSAPVTVNLTLLASVGVVNAPLAP
jgi:hypothetical protein